MLIVLLLCLLWLSVQFTSSSSRGPSRLLLQDTFNAYYGSTGECDTHYTVPINSCFQDTKETQCYIKIECICDNGAKQIGADFYLSTDSDCNDIKSKTVIPADGQCVQYTETDCNNNLQTFYESVTEAEWDQHCGCINCPFPNGCTANPTPVPTQSPIS